MTENSTNLRDLKESLKNAGISYRDIAFDLNLTHPVVSDVLNGKYKGNQDTANSIIEYCEYKVKFKVNLNPIIYLNAELVLRAIRLAVESRKTSIEEKIKLIQICEPISEYIEANKETDSDTDSN